MDTSSLELRAKRGLTLLTLLGIGLLATHRGEFWPYSIYPMFSQAGRTWTRALVREDQGLSSAERWRERALSALPGEPFALSAHDIPQIDFSEYIDHTTQWTPERIAGLRAMFRDVLPGRSLLIYGVRPGEHGVESAVATPLLRMDERGVELSPGAMP